MVDVMIVSFLQRTLSLSTFFFCPHRSLSISSDSYLHWSGLSHRLHSSSSSSFPSYSLSFYDDMSLQLGQALLGPCMFSSSYINFHTSCTLSLTLTYLLLPWIYQVILSLVSELSESLSYSWVNTPLKLLKPRHPFWHLNPWRTTLQVNSVQLSLRSSLPRPSVTKGQSYLIRLSPL